MKLPTMTKLYFSKLNLLVAGQSESGSMIAPVGHSIHRMSCVFHLPLHPTLTNILPFSTFLLADL